MYDDMVASLVRIVDELDTELRATADPMRRRALCEVCRQIEWRVNSLATPRAYHVLGP